MDPVIIKDLANLHSQVAGLQADIIWLTRLVWAMIGLNGAAFLMNGFISATMMIRKNKGNS